MNQERNIHEYDDIIHLPHHISTTRPHMPMADRAAQFSPFAALTGYDAAVKECARLTDAKINLDENAIAELDTRLQLIRELLPDCPEVSITFFVPDKKKEGGAYETRTGYIKRIDELERVLLMQSKERIPIDDILSIESKIFEALESIAFTD